MASRKQEHPDNTIDSTTWWAFKQGTCDAAQAMTPTDFERWSESVAKEQQAGKTGRN